jgi:hypothetical protein
MDLPTNIYRRAEEFDRGANRGNERDRGVEDGVITGSPRDQRVSEHLSDLLSYSA